MLKWNIVSLKAIITFNKKKYILLVRPEIDDNGKITIALGYIKAEFKSLKEEHDMLVKTSGVEIRKLLSYLLKLLSSPNHETLFSFIFT